MKIHHINTGLLIGGFTMAGMAAGWLFGDLRIGLFAGIGIGMILSAFVKPSKEQENEG